MAIPRAFTAWACALICLGSLTFSLGAQAGEDQRVNWLDLYRYINQAVPRPDGEGLADQARRRYVTEESKRAFELREKHRFSETGLTREYQEFIKKHLIQITIEGINSCYADDLSTVWKQMTLISGGLFFGMSSGEKELIQRYVRGAFFAKTLLPTKRWIVEVRGFTYHQGGSAFVKETIFANLANPSVQLAKELTDKVAKVRNRISYMTLLKCDQVLNPDPRMFVYLEMSYLPTLLTEPHADPKGPLRATRIDPALPTQGLDRNDWRPVGEMALDAFSRVYDGPGRPKTRNIPGPARTEFVLVFLWDDPLLATGDPF